MVKGRAIENLVPASSSVLLLDFVDIILLKSCFKIIGTEQGIFILSALFPGIGQITCAALCEFE